MIKTVSQTPGCKGCPMRTLFRNNTFVSLQRPNPTRNLNRLVIAEAPGKKESEKGQPLVGAAGQAFNSLLRKARIPRDGLTIINCLNCQPPKNIFPTDSKAKYISKEKAQIAVEHCLKHHVDPIIRKRDWARVDLLGLKAVRLVAKIKKGRMSDLRGHRVEIQRSGRGPVTGVPIYHPSYLLKPMGQSKWPLTVIDLKTVLGHLPQFGN